MRMEATLREEGGYVVAVEVMRAAQEAAREEVALLVADEGQREGVASLKLHDTLVKHPYLLWISTLDANIQRYQTFSSGTTF